MSSILPINLLLRRASLDLKKSYFYVVLTKNQHQCLSLLSRRLLSNNEENTKLSKVTLKLKKSTRENVLTVPNLLGVIRIGLTPAIVACLYQQNNAAAVGLFIIAGLSDLIDGLIARCFPSQRSNFGSILDPIADKLLVGFVFLSLSLLGHLPHYIFALTLMKDLIILLGASAIRYRTMPNDQKFTWSKYFDPTLSTVTVTPTTLGKLNTVLQLTLICSTMCSLVWPAACSDKLLLMMLYSTTATTCCATVQYFFAMVKDYKSFN